MIKLQILDFLNEIHDYDQIYDFFNELIDLKKNQDISKEELYLILMNILQEDVYGDGLVNDIVTDTLDYFVGWHSPLTQEHPAFDFVKKLNS